MFKTPNSCSTFALGLKPRFFLIVILEKEPNRSNSFPVKNLLVLSKYEYQISNIIELYIIRSNNLNQMH